MRQLPISVIVVTPDEARMIRTALMQREVELRALPGDSGVQMGLRYGQLFEKVRDQTVLENIDDCPDRLTGCRRHWHRSSEVSRADR
jgi:hypothetical protein